MATILGTVSREQMLATFLTSLEGPTADLSPYSNLKHTPHSTTTKVLPFTKRSRIFTCCTSPVMPKPSHPSRNFLRSLPTTTLIPRMPPPSRTPRHIPVESRHLPKQLADERRRTTLQFPSLTILPPHRQNPPGSSASRRRGSWVPTTHAAFHPSSTSSKR